MLSVVLFGSAAHAASTTGTTTLTYQAAGISNLSVTVSGSNFLFTDSGDSITFNSVTTAAGTAVSVPTTGVTAIVINLADGADTISAGGVVLSTQTLTITHSGTGLTLTGPLTTTTAAISVTNSGTGYHSKRQYYFDHQRITVSSNNNLFQNANIAASSTGAITLKASQDGAGTDGYTQKVGTATTTRAPARSPVTVNTTGGGTGNCNINTCNTGSAATLTIAANGGSILNNSGDALTTAQIGTTNGGAAPTHVLTATNYTFTVTGAGSSGTTTIPIEATNVGSDSQAAAHSSPTCGDGGNS